MKIHVATLADRPQPFGDLESFHHTSSPAEWLAVSESEPPHQTVAELTELVAEETRLLGVTAEQAPKATRRSILRRNVHWSVWSIHILWDAWTHERDLSSALALAPDYGPGELRMATMYSLLAAATPAARSQDYVRTIVLLKGSPDGRYEIAEEGGSVRITSAACSTERLIGPADQVLTACLGGARTCGNCCRARPLRSRNWPCCSRRPPDLAEEGRRGRQCQSLHRKHAFVATSRGCGARL